MLEMVDRAEQNPIVSATQLPQTNTQESMQCRMDCFTGRARLRLINRRHLSKSVGHGQVEKPPLRPLQIWQFSIAILDLVGDLVPHVIQSDSCIPMSILHQCMLV